MINLLRKITQHNQNIFLFLIVLLSSHFVFASGIDTLATNVTSEIKTTAEAIFKILNTVVASIGVAYVVLIGMVYIFKPDTFKENSKLIIGALVALGVLYAVTSMGTSFFGS